jgi:hypothetical protein
MLSAAIPALGFEQLFRKIAPTIEQIFSDES